MSLPPEAASRQVLIVDADAARADCLRTAAARAGCSPLTGSATSAGIAALAACPPLKAVVMAVEPHDLSNLVFLARLRELPCGASATLIVVTAAAGASLKALGNAMAPLSVAMFLGRPWNQLERVLGGGDRQLDSNTPPSDAASCLREIINNYQQLMSEPHHVRLGVARGASPEDVRIAFVAKAAELCGLSTQATRPEDMQTLRQLHDDLMKSCEVLCNPVEQPPIAPKPSFVPKERGVGDARPMWEMLSDAARLQALTGDYAGAAELVGDALLLKRGDPQLKYRKQLYLGIKFKNVGRMGKARYHLGLAVSLAPPDVAHHAREQLERVERVERVDEPEGTEEASFLDKLRRWAGR